MSDEKPWTVSVHKDATNDMEPEQIDKMLEQVQAIMGEGGIEALHNASRAVYVVESFDDDCPICKNELEPDPNFDDERICNATEECKGYVFYEDDSEMIQLIRSRIEEAERE